MEGQYGWFAHNSKAMLDETRVVCFHKMPTVHPISSGVLAWASIGLLRLQIIKVVGPLNTDSSLRSTRIV